MAKKKAASRSAELRCSSEPDNLKFWKLVEETHPDYKKKANNGRFDFTAVDPHYQLMRATDHWGQYGDRWGIRSMKWTLLQGSVGDSIMLEAVFFYPNWLTEEEVSFEYAIDLKFHPGMDLCKRSITAFRSKCLSLLGFSADAFLGRYDDPEYSKSMEKKYGDQEAIYEQCLGAIRLATDEEKLRDWESRILTAVTGGTIEPSKARSLQDEIEKRRAELLVN